MFSPNSSATSRIGIGLMVVMVIMVAGQRSGVAQSPTPDPLRPAKILESLRRLKPPYIGRRRGRVVNIVLSRTRVTDDDLRLVGQLSDLTDLSLEQTQVGDKGLSHLARSSRWEE